MSLLQLRRLSWVVVLQLQLCQLLLPLQQLRVLRLLLRLCWLHEWGLQLPALASATFLFSCWQWCGLRLWRFSQVLPQPLGSSWLHERLRSGQTTHALEDVEDVRRVRGTFALK